MALQIYPSSGELLTTFLYDVRRFQINNISGTNPLLINVNGEQMYVYIKNLSPAQLSNDNPDIWRIQLPKRYEFNDIKKSNKLFILLGYDYVRRVYTTWNPYWCKQRLNVAESCSMYSRLSLQKRVSDNQRIEVLPLQNEGEVVCIPSALLASFLRNVRCYFPQESEYVPINSSLRKYKRDEEEDDNNVVTESPTLFVNSSPTDNKKEVHKEKVWPAYTLDHYGKLNALDSTIIEQLIPLIRDDDYPDYEVIIKQVKEYYPPEATEKMTPADWMKLFSKNNWKRTSDSGNRGEGSKKKTHIIRVEFPDGRVVKDNNVSTTYCEFIKDIGAEAVNILDIYHADVNIVSRELDSKYSGYQRDIGSGWYVLTVSSTKQKYDDIKKIIAAYELESQYKVSLVSLGSPAVLTTDMPENSPKREKLKVRFPGGRVIQPNTVLDALLEVVKYAGAERVRALNIIVCGDNMILKNPSPRYVKPSKPVGNGWLCNTCSDTHRKFDQIMEISKRLNLGLEVEFV